MPPARPILILQHHAAETAGVFADMLRERAWPTVVVRPDLGEPVPADPRRFTALIVMGGPMGVYEADRYPWLDTEDALLKAAIAADHPTLGICLGSQVIAKAAGARVAPGPEKEIGWYPITRTDDGRRDPLFSGLPDTFDVLEWHGDVFDLPPGAAGLARSSRYPHQALRIGRRVYGLLFHLEATAAMVRTMVEEFRAEVDALGDPSRPDDIWRDAERRAAAANRHARTLFETFLGMAER